MTGVGFAVQAGAAVEGAMLTLGGSVNTFSALTRTGMTAPVTRLNGWCPRARKIAAMEPEWLVKEM